MEITLPRPNRPKSRQSIAHPPSVNGSNDTQENATIEVSSFQRARSGGDRSEKKKTRGKSLGPGGIEALRETTGNAGLSSSLLPKSILKPAIPLTPPKAIPSFDELRKRSTGKGKSPTKNNPDELLIDFSTPGPARASSGRISMTGAENVVDPFSPIRRPKSPNVQAAPSLLEDDEDAAARERDLEEQRKLQKEAILAHRAARRKSMANRRVSFAPEATLHTWNVIELAEDSTSSSASNSTRRQSSMTAAQSPHPAQSPVIVSGREGPETPTEQSEDPVRQTSPVQQRESHESKRRRRSSTTPRTDVERSPETVFSSSPANGSSIADVESSPVRIEDSIHSSSDGEDDTEVDGDTAMSMDDATTQSLASERSGSSTSSLDQRLKRAANMAGTRGIEYDEYGDDLPMEMATGTVTNAFQPWTGAQHQNRERDLSAMLDQENVNPFPTTSESRNNTNDVSAELDDAGDEMTMDVTCAVGGILPGPSSPGKGKRKSVAASRRRSSVARRRSLVDESDGETMDFTTVGGGIIQNNRLGEESTHLTDEDLSMDFTNIVGGLLNRNDSVRRDSTQSMMMDDNETMDMTAAIGGILPVIEERTEPTTENDRNMTMDITRAVGAILPASLQAKDKTLAKQLMEEEVDIGQFSVSPHEEAARATSVTPLHFATSVASETGSPSLALKPRMSGRKKSLDMNQSTSLSNTPIHMTPTKSSSSKHTTPTKQITPRPGRSEPPNRTPLGVNVTHRGASPKKLFGKELKARASPRNTNTTTSAKKAILFERDEHTGQQTPSIVLRAPKPHQHLRRRSSGIGIDQEGLGSPRVTELLDRRVSIGEVASVFNLGYQEQGHIRFEDPRKIAEEVDAERAEDERRESGRFIMEQEANENQEENATLQLKEMIESMSPKKTRTSKLKGRKSLAVGGAKGVLGKRPAELDMEEDDDAELTPKRLKKVEMASSPVKKFKLPQPPSKEETTGRITIAKHQQFGTHTLTENLTPTLRISLGKLSEANTPQHGRFREAPENPGDPRPESFEDKMDNVLDAVDVTTAQIQANEVDASAEERISLQTFLNMTNIHFIELSTTKRRHTLAPAVVSMASHDDDDKSSSLEVCLVAAASTLPRLELYQHATRELKNYISTGRKIIRSIELETLKDQPQLFREYVDARPDIRSVMDNQFRNGKTNARLQSKEGWYAWRRQLVDGLRAGLETIKQGMQNDAARLEEQEGALENILPELISQHTSLEQQVQTLEHRTAEYDSIDHEALQKVRRHLAASDAELAQKNAQLEALMQQMQEKTETLAAAAELKAEMQEQIAEAERVHEECRGWSGKHVRELKSKVDEIEKSTGWKLVAAEEDIEESNGFGVAITMTYKDELKLFFHPAAFKEKEDGRRRSGRKSRSVSGPNAPISLSFSGNRQGDGGIQSDLSTERRFFLQLIRSQLQAMSMMPKGSISARSILLMVERGWNLASKVSEEVRLLNLAGIATASILGDERIGASLMLILNESRINVDFALTVSVDSDGDFQTSSTISANAAYGEVADLLAAPGKSKKVQTALSKEIESRELGTGAWVNSVKGLEHWIAAQLLIRHQQPAPTPRAAIASAQPSQLVASMKQPPKSPLAPKSTNRVLKRSIPVPQRTEKMKIQTQTQNNSENDGLAENNNKENMDVTPVKSKAIQAEDIGEMTIGRPAIPPELQEEMMRTPIKRVGALRRSPIVG